MTITAFENCRIFDGHGPEYIEDHRVIVAEGRIQALEPMSGKPPQDAEIVDCGARVLMPGLIDCHFHAYGVSFSFYELDRMPRELLAQHGAKTMRDTLHRGFTTIRDAAGADIGLWLALERGLIEGPRLFYPGRALSQTGGHGDMRPGDQIEASACACGYMGSLTVTADGPDEVRKAVREELRKGAHQIKIFISGGVVSPTDPLWMPQFSDEEVRAAVEEAATRRTYVMAHCHTDDGARRCVELGVRTIEHGSEILDDTAKAIVKAGAYVVPTLSVMHVIKDYSGQLGSVQQPRQDSAGPRDHARRDGDLRAPRGQAGPGVRSPGTRIHEAARQGVRLPRRGPLPARSAAFSHVDQCRNPA